MVRALGGDKQGENVLGLEKELADLLGLGRERASGGEEGEGENK